MPFVSLNTKNLDYETYFSFDGESTKREVSTEFKHPDGQLGNYKGSPFVTGGSPNPRGNGLITEILDIEAGTWVQADDYPFSGDRYVQGSI